MIWTATQMATIAIARVKSKFVISITSIPARERIASAFTTRPMSLAFLPGRPGFRLL
jgi:hypothetical protein